ncbi:alternate signal-mediated exported protein [Georgenia soli]|uniref:Alternate signal-mediated exported protein n=1 Tax=Georgenia soli TaxID=638953 RepID=A0A2A9EJH2_9MICO|nr:alternate-type signal peptide domain-containing protein [Georgenia soli]PFG39094.1 alternate signal-mediated exported protein [Georgenia soli]
MAVTTAEKPRSRSKLTKALVATGVGVALLAGGGGTFAAWTSEATVDPGSITSGKLQLVQPAEEGRWRSVTTNKGIQNISAYDIVPGETLTYTQNIQLVAEGAALEFELDANIDGASGAIDDDVVSALEETAQITVNGAKFDGPMIMRQGAKNLEVQVRITLPADTTEQDQSFILKKITVSARQTAPADASLDDNGAV